MKTCTTCSAQLGARNKTGYCRLHASAAVASRPEWRANHVAGIKRKHQTDPAFLDALRKRARKQGTRKDTRKQRSERFKRDRVWEVGGPVSQTPEARAKAGRTLSATRMAWCPTELRAAYRELTKLGYRAPEARRLILDQHESDMARFRAKLDPNSAASPTRVEPVPPPPINPTLSLVDRAITAAAWGLGTTLAEARTATRVKPAVRARWAALVRLREDGLSFPKIGAALGLDHTSVIYGYQQSKKLAAVCPVFAAAVDLARAA